MSSKVIKVFEYGRLTVGEEGFTQSHFEALAAFVEYQKVPWFQPGYRCIHFNQHVGVVQVNDLTIEILPKIDKYADASRCHEHLVEMLCQTGDLKVAAPTRAMLKWKRNSLLDLYIGYYVEEVRQLIHRGLIRRYRRIQGNKKVLKGKLLVGQQIRQNLVYKERFCCEYTTYDRDHLLHQILWEALQMLSNYWGARPWISEIRLLMLEFPECTPIAIDESIFSQMAWDRKSEPYAEAIHIARMLLFNYHPDFSRGANDVLALLFDMNSLFERWFLGRLMVAARSIPDVTISGQVGKRFWSSNERGILNIRPDIVVFKGKQPVLILDTKWKQMNGEGKPSADDLQQLYAYNHLFSVAQSYLVYPGNGGLEISNGWFGDDPNDRCGICLVPLIKGGRLNKAVGEALLERIAQIA